MGRHNLFTFAHGRGMKYCDQRVPCVYISVSVCLSIHTCPNFTKIFSSVQHHVITAYAVELCLSVCLSQVTCLRCGVMCNNLRIGLQCYILQLSQN